MATRLASSAPHHSQVTNITRAANSAEKSLRKSAKKAEITVCSVLCSDVMCWRLSAVASASQTRRQCPESGHWVSAASAVTGFTALCPITRSQALDWAQAGPASSAQHQATCLPCLPAPHHCRVCREHNLLHFCQNSLV